MVRRWFIMGILAVIVLFFSIGAMPAGASTTSMWNSGAGNWDWSRSKLTANYFNGDANGDVAILYNYGGDNTGLWLFTSAGSTFNAPTLKWSSGPGNWDWNRSKMLSGNFVNDVYRDIAVLYDYGNSNTGLWLFQGKATGFDPPSLKWISGAGNWDWNRSKIVAGIFNLDAYTDIAVLYDYGNSTTGLWIFPGTATGAFGAPTQVWNSGAGNWDWNRSQLTAQDINNDGVSEIGIVYDYGASTGLWTVFPVAGTVYNNWNSGAGNWDSSRSKAVGLLWDLAPGSGLPLADIAILYDYGNSNTALWIFRGVGLNSPSQYWSSGIGNWDWNRSMITATDVNGGGLDDLIILYDYGNSTSGLWRFYY